jgi:hypothetical protein
MNKKKERKKKSGLTTSNLLFFFNFKFFVNSKIFWSPFRGREQKYTQLHHHQSTEEKKKNILFTIQHQVLHFEQLVGTNIYIYIVKVVNANHHHLC